MGAGGKSWGLILIGFQRDTPKVYRGNPESCPTPRIHRPSPVLEDILKLSWTQRTESGSQGGAWRDNMGPALKSSRWRFGNKTVREFHQYQDLWIVRAVRSPSRSMNLECRKGIPNGCSKQSWGEEKSRNIWSCRQEDCGTATTYLVPHESASLVWDTTSRGQHKAMAPAAQLNPITWEWRLCPEPYYKISLPASLLDPAWSWESCSTGRSQITHFVGDSDPFICSFIYSFKSYWVWCSSQSFSRLWDCRGE